MTESSIERAIVVNSDLIAREFKRGLECYQEAGCSGDKRQAKESTLTRISELIGLDWEGGYEE